LREIGGGLIGDEIDVRINFNAEVISKKQSQTASEYIETERIKNKINLFCQKLSINIENKINQQLKDRIKGTF